MPSLQACPGGARAPTEALRQRCSALTAGSAVLRPSLERATDRQRTAQCVRAEKIVGFGGIGLDYLASVTSFPEPDGKYRTSHFEMQGGGNSGNAMTAAARLGLSPTLCSKIGDDSIGDNILQELNDDGVDTGSVLRAAGCPSPFTYIIVDQADGTRTCIHTPAEAMRDDELRDEALSRLLEGAQLVCFDGRLTEAAVPVAVAARAAGVLVVVELERLRPRLDELAALADVVVTSEAFPQDWTGEGCLGAALVSTLARLPRATSLITTLGTRGSVLLRRLPEEGDCGAERRLGPRALETLLTDALKEVATGPRDPAPAEERRWAARSTPDAPVQAGSVLLHPEALRLSLEGSTDGGESVSEARAAAAVRAAASNADAENSGQYVSSDAADGGPCGAWEVAVAGCARLPSSDSVRDTTGAGDAFIGACCYGLVRGLDAVDMLRLAAVVSAAKCTGMGARAALPTRDQIDPSLL